MNPESIHRFLMETRNCAMQMMENAAYIKNELPLLTMPDAIRSQIVETCDELIGTKHDLIHDVFEIRDLMESSPDPAVLKQCMESIRGMIGMSNIAFHDCVQSAADAVKMGEADPLVSMLLTESGFNILTSVPTFPPEEVFSEDAPGNQTDDEEESDESEEDEDSDDDCFAFNSEDSHPIRQLTNTIRRLAARSGLPPATIDHLKVFLFAMERLPLITPAVRMSLALRLDQAGESDWIEIRMEDAEFTLGRGSWLDGDADTETVFEVGQCCRDGDAFVAMSFADSFRECANDLCREIVIDDFSDEPFQGWDLPQDPNRWSSLHCDFL